MASLRRKGGRSGRLTTSMIGLSAAAIVSVYAVGYMNTRGTDGSLVSLTNASAAATPILQSPQVVTSPGDSRNAGRLAPLATPTPASAPSSQQAAAYRDGTYTGSGNSRHGGMVVTIVVKDAKLVSAAVTSCQTRYDCAKVDGLVKEVVTKQVVPVDHVSGATDSSNAYKQAVAAALVKAKAG